MSLVPDTASRKDLRLQQLSLEESLFVESDVLRLVSRMCEAAEATGYVVPEEFELGEFLQAVEEELLSPVALAEAELNPAHREKQGFLKRMVGAAKGAISRGVVSATRKLMRHHAAKADAALDKASGLTVSTKERESAETQFRKHHVKKVALGRKLNPVSHADLARGKEQQGLPAHGSAGEADVILQKSKEVTPQHVLLKLQHPMQARSSRERLVSSPSIDAEPMPGTKTRVATGMTPTYKKSKEATKPGSPGRAAKQHRDSEATHVLRRK